MKTVKIDYKNIYYPPGGILLWIIIFLELVTFGIALVFFVLSSKENPELFHTSRLQLNSTIGMFNTVFLLTSGFFMALTVKEFKNKNILKSKKYLLVTMLFGILFLALKTIEYSAKLEAGLGIGYNTFFAYYWLLTLFHVIHVIVGLVILTYLYFELKKDRLTTEVEDVEASAAFWHMCDLIWLLLFPTIYLIL